MNTVMSLTIVRHANSLICPPSEDEDHDITERVSWRSALARFICLLVTKLYGGTE